MEEIKEVVVISKTTKGTVVFQKGSEQGLIRNIYIEKRHFEKTGEVPEKVEVIIRRITQ